MPKFDFNKAEGLFLLFENCINLEASKQRDNFASF